MLYSAWNYPSRVSCSDPLSGQGCTARRATSNAESRLLRSLRGWDITSLDVGLTFATPLSVGNAVVANNARAGSNQRHHDFRLLTSVDEEQHHLLLAFRLPVDLKVGGRRATRMFFYHISPASLSDANALHYTLEDPSKLQYSLAVSAAKDAGFCAPGRSMRVTLQLSQPGRVLMSKLNADTIQPSTKTSRAVLDQFRSLSTALHIDLYLDSGDGPSMLERLDSICAAVRDGSWKQADLRASTGPSWSPAKSSHWPTSC